tara:strand:+ start:144 stop:1178 length:1035 start_codon:yes stop_codon:yes gene_type:complete
MAIDANAYSPKQFTFLIAEQDDFGTFNLESTGGGTRDANNWVALDVDSIGSPSLNLNQGIEPRTGSRILQATDFFQDNKAKVIEMSVSGTATTEVLDMLIPNITQSADTSSPYGLASNIGSQTFVAATDDQQDMQIFSIAYNSPSSGNTLGFKDCFCTSLSLSGDSGTEGGRVKFSATFKTGTLPEDLTDGLLTVDTAITSNNHFMSSWDADDRIVAGIANCLVSSFTLNIENDMVFSGVSSTGYESAARVGEVSATADFSVKYDANTDVLFENFHDQAVGASEGATLMAHQASLADGTFGFKFASSVMTSVAFNEGDMMMLDVSVKAVGAGTGSGTVLFEVAC